MILRSNGRALECIVVDVNTQNDFCHPHGAYPVINLAELTPALRRMVAWAKRNAAPVISSVESHRPAEVPDNGHPLYCIDGTTGQRKIDFTLMPRCTQIEFDNTWTCPCNLFERYQQVIFPKRTLDLLDNPKAERFVTQAPAPEFILCGVATESSVKALALGLLAREKAVTVVVDACGYWNKATADLAIRQMIAKGVRLITLNELRTRKLDRRWRHLTRNASANGQDHGHNGNGRHATGSEPHGPDVPTGRGQAKPHQ
jgi:nicotinamidase-related amidase